MTDRSSVEEVVLYEETVGNARPSSTRRVRDRTTAFRRIHSKNPLLLLTLASHRSSLKNSNKSLAGII